MSNAPVCRGVLLSDNEWRRDFPKRPRLPTTRTLDSGVLLLAKPYRKPDLARMMRLALDNGVAAAPAG
jgi:hypothetical protein